MDDIVIAFVFKEPDDLDLLGTLIEICKEPFKDVPNVKINMANGDAAQTIKFFLENGELPVEDIPIDGSKGLQTFKKKPVEIKAVQLRWSTWNDVCDLLGDSLKDEPAYNIPIEEVSHPCDEPGPEYLAVNVTTTHGELAVVRHGDWIIPDSKPGTFYPCKPDVFEATYTPVVGGES